MKNFTSEEVLAKFKGAVCQYINNIDYDGYDMSVFPDSLVVSWFVKNLQNYKACLYCPDCPGLYFECSFNGDKNDVYLDVYEKVENCSCHLE
jgi:hypothetical protein